MGEWQPIATAPRDGTRIELLIPFKPESKAYGGYWDAYAVRLGWGDRRTDQDWRKLRIKAMGCFRFDRDDGGFDIQPTHWRFQQRVNKPEPNR